MDNLEQIPAADFIAAIQEQPMPGIVEILLVFFVALPFITLFLGSKSR
jgi:hypothetical protein